MNSLNLKDKIDILYNFAYENKESNLTDKIYGDIKMSDIKFSSKSKILDSLKNQSLGNVTLVNTIPLSNTIILNGKELPMTLFISPYLKDSDIKDNHNPFNLDSTLSYLFSPLVINKSIPNIMLPIINYDIKLNNLPNNILMLKPFMSLQKKIMRGKYSDTLNVRVRENFTPKKSLKSYLSSMRSNSKNKINIKPIIFQTLYTLKKLNDEYNGFKHNNLTTSNIYLSENDEMHVYKVNNDKFYLDFNNDFVKITNFENSYIPNMFKSSNLSNDNFKFMKNKSFDVHYFLNNLVNEIDEKNVIDSKSYKKFMNKALPKKFRGKGKYNFYMGDNFDMISIEEMLNDEYFNEFKVKGEKNIDVTISKKEEKKLEKMLGLDNKKSKKEKKKQKGGYIDKTVPIKNNPNLSNDKRETIKKQFAEKPKPKEPPVLVEQKIYNPEPAKPPRKDPVLPFVPINTQNGLPLVNYPYPYGSVLNKVPIQKIYNITIGDPSVTGSYIGEFFEDMLPGNPYPLNSLSLNDRIRLKGFVRNILIDKHDGEEMNITGGEKSFRKHVKFGPFNPYSLANSPYDDISSRFTLYSVFYPIRYDSDRRIFNVAKDATSFNLRTYDLSIGSLYSDRLTDSMKLENFNVFRELNYYKFITSEIINKKVSPNFVNMLLYKIDTETKIKYDKLVEVKMRHLPRALRNLAYKPLDVVVSMDEQINVAREFLTELNKKITSNNDKIPADPLDLSNYIDDILKDDDKKAEAEKLLHPLGLTLEEIKPSMGKRKMASIANFKNKIDQLKKALFMFGVKDKNVKLSEESKKSLVVMTEGPTHNFFRWSCPSYTSNGAQKTMIQTGYHTYEAWKSVFFQIINVFLVFEKYNIYFRELSLHKNIFIKDVYYDAGNIGFWKYIINDTSYYVPNHGYIVMFDSSYSDKIDVFKMKKTVDETEFHKVKDEMNYKILSTELFESNEELDKIIDPDENKMKEMREEALKVLLKEDILRILDPSKLTQDIRLMGGILPDEKFLVELRGLYNDYKDGEKLINLLPKYFAEFLHTKVGSNLTKSEMSNVSLIPVRNLKKGKLVIYQERYGEYKWAVYVDEDNSTQIKKHKIIIDKKGNERSVFLSSLRSYPENLSLTHNYVKGYKYNEDDLLDTYEI